MGQPRRLRREDPHGRFACASGVHRCNHQAQRCTRTLRRDERARPPLQAGEADRLVELGLQLPATRAENSRADHERRGLAFQERARQAVAIVHAGRLVDDEERVIEHVERAFEQSGLHSGIATRTTSWPRSWSSTVVVPPRARARSAIERGMKATGGTAGARSLPMSMASASGLKRSSTNARLAGVWRWMLARPSQTIW